MLALSKLMSCVTHMPGLEKIWPVCLLEIKSFRTSIPSHFFLSSSEEGENDQTGVQKEKIEGNKDISSH